MSEIPAEDIRGQGEVIEIRETKAGKFYWRLVDESGEELDRLKRARFDDAERHKATREAAARTEAARLEREEANERFRLALIEGKASKVGQAREAYVDAHAAHDEILASSGALTPHAGARRECELAALEKYPGRPVVVFGVGQEP